MRKILSNRKKKSKERFNKILFGIALLFIIILSTIGYSLNSSINQQDNGEKVVYNGNEFIGNNGFWFMKIGEMEFAFRYNPNEVMKINEPVNYFNTYYNLPLYIQSDNELATSEIYNNMINVVQRMQKACIDENECEEDIPVKNCSSNFIIIKEDNLTSITQDNGCVFITGDGDNLVKATDEFLFKTLGIEGN